MPKFADLCENIEKMLFATVTARGMTFVTDEFHQCFIFYHQSSLPRIVTYLGKRNEGYENDPVRFEGISLDKLLWN